MYFRVKREKKRATAKIRTRSPAVAERLRDAYCVCQQLYNSTINNNNTSSTVFYY